MRIRQLLERAFPIMDIPAEHAALVRGEQVSAFKKALPFGITATAVNMSIIAIFCLSNEPDLGTFIWSALALFGVLLGTPVAVAASRSKKTVHPRPASHLNRPLHSAVMFGILWGLAPLIMMNGASTAELMLLTAVCAGMMCGGAYIFSTVPRASMAFVTCIAIGFAGGIFTAALGISSKLALMALLISYTAVMCCAAQWNYSNYVRAWLQKIELNNQKVELGKQNEVISLLLHDFEKTASDCLWETDKKGRLERMTDDLAERLNADPAKAQSRFIRDVLVSAGAEGYEVDRLLEEIRDNGFIRDALLCLRANDTERWLSFSGKRKDDGGYRGVVGDVTDAHEAEAQIRYMAHFDSLTNLANREQLKHELSAAIEREESTGKGFAILCIDLDRFKVINDVHGHLVGDAVLGACADRMRACLADGDVAARVGGDEFVVLQKLTGDYYQREELARQLNLELARPIHLAQLTVQLSVSIGVATYPENGRDVAILLRNADLALYRAKQEGRARVCFFEQAMDDEASARREVETDLREAMQNGEFRLFFQPLVDSDTRKAVGFEALLRWDHPIRGLISPEDFITIAEQTGMISTIGEWVIREALLEAACWPDEQGISINLSPLQVKNPTLLPTVMNALAASGVAPQRLEFEITESVLLDAADGNLKTLHDLHELGIRISLDDFGTGYSSLSYLSSFPFDKIKIDKSFVQSIGDSAECQAIVRAVAGLAGSLGIRSTAEGVETQDQIDSVLAEGCSELQGFYFSRPQAAETLAEAGLLRRLPRDAEKTGAAAHTLATGTRKTEAEEDANPVLPKTDRNAL